MATWRVNSGASAEWVANHAYSLGNRCVCRSTFPTQARRKYTWECTTAGTSHATTEPTWIDGPAGSTIGDGSAVWTCRLPNDGVWANATCYLGYIMSSGSPIAEGDQVFIHKAHNENKNWGSYYYLYGSDNDLKPLPIFCVDKDNSDALSTGAIVQNGSTGYQIVLLRVAYMYGVQLKNGYGVQVGSSTEFGIWYLESDGADGFAAIYNTAAANYPLGIGSSANYLSTLTVINADIYIWIPVSVVNGHFHWRGGKLLSAANAFTPFLAPGSFSSKIVIEDVDLSKIGDYFPGNQLISFGTTAAGLWDTTISRCKLPQIGDFTGPFTGTEARIYNGRTRIHHCSGYDRYYEFWERDSFGTIESETTIVRTGGANDGSIGQAWKMASSANVVEGLIGFMSMPIHAWNDFTVEKTFTIECIWDSAVSLQNDEIWMELEFPADATSGLGSVSRIKCAPLGSPSNVQASAATWTTTGMSNPNAFLLQAVVTPGKKGPVTARIFLAKPNTTIYVDPLIKVT